MLDLVWASAGFAFVALTLYFNAIYLSSKVASVRDEVFDKALQGALQGALAADSPVTPSQLMKQLGQAFGVCRTSAIVALLADVQPNGYRRAIWFFSGATAVAFIGSLFPKLFILMGEYGWLPRALWGFFVACGILFLVDDTKYYVRLFRIRRAKGEFSS